MPGAAEARALYRVFLREGAKFPNYNIREYVKLRARQGFEARAEPAAAAGLWAQAQADLGVVKRQAVVYSMYSRPHKNVMEMTQEALP